MHIKGKLMNQTLGNGKQSNSGFDFGLFGPILDPKNFFRGFYLY